MEDLFYTIGKNKYIVDFNALRAMCIQADKSSSIEKETTEIYEASEKGTLDATQKVIRELKTPSNPQNDTIMYDFVKLMLSQVLDMPSRFSDDMSLGDALALNALISCGIIRKVEDL